MSSNLPNDPPAGAYTWIAWAATAFVTILGAIGAFIVGLRRGSGDDKERSIKNLNGVIASQAKYIKSLEDQRDGYRNRLQQVELECGAMVHKLRSELTGVSIDKDQLIAEKEYLLEECDGLKEQLRKKSG